MNQIKLFLFNKKAISYDSGIEFKNLEGILISNILSYYLAKMFTI